jgi:hypothetical protein
MMDAVSECATSGAVVGTVASPAYAKPMLSLAESAHLIGFHCIVVQPYTFFPALRSHYVRALSIPEQPLLPRTHWCGSQRYGWRRSHLYRTRMWHAVLRRGIDLLAVDLDWSFVDLHGVLLNFEMPLPFLRAARTVAGDEPDVIALHDGRRKGLFNVGLMYVRASVTATRMSAHCENRSFGGWEQGVFNEELNFGIGRELKCCHAPPQSQCDLTTFARPNNWIHNLGHEPAHARKRRSIDGEDACAPLLPSATPPPRDSRYQWIAVEPNSTQTEGQKPTRLSGWQSGHYNMLASRPLARCTALDNLCRCPPHRNPDDHWRTMGGEKIRHFFERTPDKVNLTVRGEGFRLGLMAQRRVRRGRNGNGSTLPWAVVNQTSDGAPILLREWLGWRPP